MVTTETGASRALAIATSVVGLAVLVAIVADSLLTGHELRKAARKLRGDVERFFDLPSQPPHTEN